MPQYTGTTKGTSNMLISNVAWVNITGEIIAKTANRTAAVSCSQRRPCYNIEMRDISLKPSADAPAMGANGECFYVAPGGIHGMTGEGCE